MQCSLTSSQVNLFLSIIKKRLSACQKGTLRFEGDMKTNVLVTYFSPFFIGEQNFRCRIGELAQSLNKKWECGFEVDAVRSQDKVGKLNSCWYRHSPSENITV